MPTRIDIPDDLAELLRATAKARGIGLRAYVQDILSSAAAVSTPAGNVADRYQQKTSDFGAHLENPWAILAELETEEFSKLLVKR